MKKFAILISLLFPVLTFAQHKKAMPTTYDLVVGTYTTGTSKGIYVYRFYVETGKLAFLNEIDDIRNPSYLCVSANNKFVYAVNEDGITSGVSAFSFEPKQGKLALINREPSGGADPCYIAIDHEQKHLFVANYSGGSLAVLPVLPNGSLGPISQNVQDEGSSVNADRQQGPHVHMAMLSPDEKYVLYTDLGTDKLNVDRYHAGADLPLGDNAASVVNVNPGEGPRHLTFSNDGKYVYLLTEMGSAVHVYDYNNGKLDEKQTITILNDGFKGKTAGAAIKISPDGKFLYATNRLETNDITVFAIAPEDGKLTLVEHVSSGGTNPRDFAIDPTGNFLVLANQNTDNILVYRINKVTGKLTRTNNTITLGNPVCLKFTSAE
jgi:6-phosphogluconolactonase